MTIKIIEIITNILDENRNVETSSIRESYVLVPDAHKVLKHVKTGEIITTRLMIDRKSRIKNYIEVDNPNTPN
jgi:hypothetical protein